jgi:hypothetical protein
MKIVIRSQRSEKGEVFEFTLLDGDDEQEKVRGYSSDLIHTFTKILEWRERINRDTSSQESQG